MLSATTKEAMALHAGSFIFLPMNNATVGSPQINSTAQSICSTYMSTPQSQLHHHYSDSGSGPPTNSNALCIFIHVCGSMSTSHMLDPCFPETSVTSKKSPNVYKSWPKMISLKNERF